MAQIPAETSHSPVPETTGARYDRMRIGYAQVTQKGVITEANALFRSQTGLPEQNMPDQSLYLTDAFPRFEVQAQLREHLAGLTPDNPVAVNCIDMGERGLFQFHTVAAFSPEGKLTGYETATVNVSDTLSTLSQALQRATLERDDARQMAHGLSHDARNPVNRAGKFVQMALRLIDRMNERNVALSDEIRDVIAEARELLARAGNNAEKAGNIMAAYLELEAISYRPYEPVPVSMGKILASLKEETQEAVERANATLIVPEAMPDPLGRRQWVEQVWVNLVGNAAKYAGAAPVIELGHEEMPDGQVKYWVKDNGPGIAPENLPKLFQRFTRLDPSVRDGHGLGLTLVKMLVEKMGGTVGVTSRPGEETVFFFILPAAPVS